MGLEQLLGGPRGRALGGLGADGLDFIDGDRAGATGKALADIREHGGDLLVAEDGALGRHIDGVALAGDFDRTAEAVEHDLDGTRRSALGPLAAHEGRQAVESLAVGAVAGAAEGVIDLGAVFGGRHENGGSQEGEERRGAHKGYGLHQAPYFRRCKSDRNGKRQSNGRAEWRPALRAEWRAEWKRQADAFIFRWRVAGPASGRDAMTSHPPASR